MYEQVNKRFANRRTRGEQVLHILVIQGSNHNDSSIMIKILGVFKEGQVRLHAFQSCAKKGALCVLQLPP